MRRVSVGRDGIAVDEARTLFRGHPRLPRMDRPTLAALVAVRLAMDAGVQPRSLVVAVEEGSSRADRAYWRTARGRDGLDASPLLFAATLPSAVAGELAITFGLRGPCVVLAGAGAWDACEEVVVPTDDGGDARLVVRLRGWDGDVDGEAMAWIDEEAGPRAQAAG